MLNVNQRKSDDTSIIYHYCSAETLLAIVQNRTIRFSDVNMLNDAEEGRWGFKIFEHAATKLLKKDGLPEDVLPLIGGIDEVFFNIIGNYWSSYTRRLSSFVSCFSTDGDSLSQWRSYADDGRGFSIGFRVSELTRQPVSIYDVEYNYESQLRAMMIALMAIYAEYNEKGRDHTGGWFFDRCSGVSSTAIAFKNPAWRDEKEVRCLHVVTANTQGKVWTLKDDGGVAAGRNVKGQQVRFQARNGAIVPYLDMPFEVTAKRIPIAQIVRGPKCPNAVGNLKFLLGNSGYGDVEIKSAGSAYR